MFDNIGNKLKTTAKALTVCGVLASIVHGIIMMVTTETFESIYLGLLICIIGSLLSWVSSFVLYGIGQLIVNTDILVNKLAPEYKETLGNEMNEENETNILKSKDWKTLIHTLNDEELIESMNSDDWQDEYKALCKQELNNRNHN